jgi:2Fe-2S ferredoxin
VGHRVTLVRTNAPPVEVDVVDGATLLRAVVRGRMPIGRSCRGEGVCAACRVRILEGVESVEPMDDVERALSAREPLPFDERYACRARLRGPVTLTTSYW